MRVTDRTAAVLATQLGSLTHAEADVLRHMMRGCTRAADIADARYTAVSTTKNHRRAIYSKLEVETAAEAVAVGWHAYSIGARSAITPYQGARNEDHR